MKRILSRLYLLMPFLALCTLAPTALIAAGRSDDGRGEGGQTVKPDAVVNRYIIGKVVSLDPALAAADRYSNSVAAPVLETLYDYDYFASGYPLVPLLAADFPQVSEDGLEYTFTISPGIHYYDPSGEVFGERERDIRAEDVVNSILRLADLSQKGKGYWLIEGFIEGLDEWRSESQNGGNYADLPPGLSVLGDYEFRVKLTQPYPQLLYFFTMNYSAPLPREVLDTYGTNGLANRLIGSGAYYLDPEETINDNRYVYGVNPTFRERRIDSEYAPAELKGKKLPLNGGLTIRLIEEGAPRWLAFQQGDLDVFTPGKDQFDQAVVNNELTPELKAKGVKLIISPSADVTYNFINFDDPLWGPIMNDPEAGPRIRKAIQLAYDYETIIDVQYNNRAVPAISPVPPIFEGFEDLTSEYNAYDPERSRQLLIEAGYPGGEGLPVLRYEAASSSKASRDLYELSKRYLEDIGIETEFVVNDWPTFSQKLDDGEFQLAGLGWGADYPDPQNFLQLLYGPNIPQTNNVRYRSDRFDALYAEAAPMLPSPERTRLYKEMIAVLEEDRPWIYGVHRLSYAMVNPRVRNYLFNEFARNGSQYLEIVE